MESQCGPRVEGSYHPLFFRSNWLTALTMVIPSHKCANVGRLHRVTHIDVKNSFFSFVCFKTSIFLASGLCYCLSQSQRNCTVIVLYQNHKKVNCLSLSSMSYSFLVNFSELDKTTHGILCISSSWQALKALTNYSLIQKKTEGGEGEADKNNGLAQL